MPASAGMFSRHDSIASRVYAVQLEQVNPAAPIAAIVSMQPDRDAQSMCCAWSTSANASVSRGVGFGLM